MTYRAAVLGHPISHSLSPVLHQAAYDALGIDWLYGRCDVIEEDLSGFIEALDRSWRGLSLTMPLKQRVIPLLDHVDPLAAVTGAVNTVLIQPVGAARALTGTNTDVHGIVHAIREARTAEVRTAVILGAGATASSALAAVAQLGCATPTVAVRSLARTADLRAAAHRMGVEPVFVTLTSAFEAICAADVVVSTLPPFAADGLAAQLSTDDVVGRLSGTLLDVAYDPQPTALIAAWAHRAGVTVTGERMLLHQAGEQVRLMTGLPAPLDAMDVALRRALERH
ncbi:shikimate dehydrogenase [Jonesia quinghaiensis]|uniref:shikimate dehydrogenase n=1 Tax=Jonesia quinghaiensis TaxID=262806 RepID=UPI000407291A|nr:shikimate dehydrogenase [Jonesia quinghaiensis]